MGEANMIEAGNSPQLADGSAAADKDEGIGLDNLIEATKTAIVAALRELEAAYAHADWTPGEVVTMNVQPTVRWPAASTPLQWTETELTLPVRDEAAGTASDRRVTLAEGLERLCILLTERHASHMPTDGDTAMSFTLDAVSGEGSVEVRRYYTACDTEDHEF